MQDSAAQLSHSDVMLTRMGKPIWLIEVYAGKPKCRDCNDEVSTDDFYCRETKKFWCRKCDKNDLSYNRCRNYVQFVLRQGKQLKHMHYKVTLEYRKREEKSKIVPEEESEVEIEESEERD